MNIAAPAHLAPEDAELYVALYHERNGFCRCELPAPERAADRARARSSQAVHGAVEKGARGAA